MKDAPDRDCPMHTITAHHAALQDADQDGIVGQRSARSDERHEPRATNPSAFRPDLGDAVKFRTYAAAKGHALPVANMQNSRAHMRVLRMIVYVLRSRVGLTMCYVCMFLSRSAKQDN